MKQTQRAYLNEANTTDLFVGVHANQKIMGKSKYFRGNFYTCCIINSNLLTFHRSTDLNTIALS